MTKDEALKMAIEVLCLVEEYDDNGVNVAKKAIQACKEALEQPTTQEPMIIKQDNGMVLKLGYDDLPNGTAFYTHPKEWQGLSDDEFVAIAKSIWGDNLGMSDGYGYTVAWASSYATIEPSSKMLLLYHAIEKALKEKNHEQT